MNEAITNEEKITKRALNIRRNIIRMLEKAGSGHAAGSLDLADIFATIYFGKLQNGEPIFHYNSQNPNDENRDLLILSNGHVCPVLYATFAEANLIKTEELMTLRKFGSRLQGHPEREKLTWLETTSGPLGEGLSQAAGMSYAIKNFDKNNSRKVFCIVGDGELDEGEIWEAAMFASAKNLQNLIAIVDKNEIQLSGTTNSIMPLEPLNEKWRSFGWNVIEIDGNNIAEILFAMNFIHEKSSINNANPESIANENSKFDEKKPTVIIAKTIPGKGVSFMENDYKWHGKSPNKEEAERALKELSEDER